MKKNQTIERRNDSAPWRYIFRTHGVNLHVQGPFIDVDAHTFSEASRIARSCVTDAWEIELKSSNRY